MTVKLPYVHCFAQSGFERLSFLSEIQAVDIQLDPDLRRGDGKLDVLLTNQRRVNAVALPHPGKSKKETLCSLYDNPTGNGVSYDPA